MKPTPAGMNPNLAIGAAKRHTAAHFGLAVDDMSGPRRAKRHALPRGIAMYLARRIGGARYTLIGERFNRERSTVLYAVRRVDLLILTNESVHAAVVAIAAAMLADVTFSPTRSQPVDAPTHATNGATP